MKKERKMKKLDSHAKSSTISRVYRCCCNFFSSKSSTISMILFRNVSLSRRKSTTRFGVSPFFRGKVTIFIGRETKIHILPTKINEKIAEVSPSNNNYSFRIILPFNNNNNTRLMQVAHDLCWRFFVVPSCGRNSMANTSRAPRSGGESDGSVSGFATSG